MFQQIDAIEFTLCRMLNRELARSGVRQFFTVVSRLGDGVLWYALIASLPALYGRHGVVVALQMAATAAVASRLYALMKRHFGRERPYVTFASIDCAVPALDRYSFPSGHTLHAVCLTMLASYHFPALAYLLVPFTLLVMLSRVVLGLHYPTDVLAGTVVGLALSVASLGVFRL
jgi:undecaprenyl-diphosphatase